MTITPLECTFFYCIMCHYLNLSPRSVRIFFTYLKGLLFIALYQHIIMVKATSFSKSNRSQVKSAHDPYKISPLTKKSITISIAKAKTPNNKAARNMFIQVNMFSVEWFQI